MSLAISAFAPEPLFTRRAYRKNMARAAKAFSAISLGAAFVLTTGEAGAQSSRASAEEGFSPLNGTPIGFNDAGDLIVLMADGSETIIPRGEYGLIGDQIMVSDMIDGVEVAQNGYIPPTSGVPVYGNTGPLGMGYASWLIPLGLVAAGVIAYIYFSRSTNEAPSFAEASYSTDFDEDETGTVLTVTATDAESDSITYSLTGADSQYFTISSSGAISFDDQPNFESPGDTNRGNDYVITAVATDDHGEASSVSVTITVDDVVETPTAAAGTYTGTAGANDITAAGAMSAIDMLGGNDSAVLSGGISAGGTVEMGSGADYLQIDGGTAGAGASIDMGAGDDELELDVDLVNALTVDLGSGDDIVDVDNTQTSTITFENFGSGGLLDLKGLNMTGTVDLQLYSTTTAATQAMTSAAGTVSVTLHDRGSDIDVYIDSAGTDGNFDMVITLDSLASLSSGQIDV